MATLMITNLFAILYNINTTNMLPRNNISTVPSIHSCVRYKSNYRLSYTEMYNALSIVVSKCIFVKTKAPIIESIVHHSHSASQPARTVHL